MISNSTNLAHRGARSLTQDFAPRDQRDALDEVASRYAVALPPALAALIDRNDPNDPIARQFVPDAAELDIAPAGTGRPDRRRRAFAGRRHRASLSRPRAAEAHPCLRGLLPLLFSARNGRARQAERAVAQGASNRARLHPRASGNLGSDPDRRRSAHAVGAPPARRDEGAGRDRPRQGRAHSHPHADRRSGAHHARSGAGDEDQGQGGLRRGARQSRARTDAGRARGLRRDGRCRHSAAGANRAARRRQRYARGHGRPDARLRRMPDQALLPAPRRSRARHRASAHRYRRPGKS